jgi:hypothetical protein
MSHRPPVSSPAPALALLAAAAGACVSPAEPPGEPLPVPFVVSDYYSPDGFFGDGEVRGQLQLDKACPSRPPGAGGDCYTVSYRPGVKRFAGIFWQHPHNNWGTWPGHTIAAGATRVSVQARGARGGEQITVGAGQNASQPHRDSFKAPEQTLALTTTWTRHEIPMLGLPYATGGSGVIGAFLLSLKAPEDDAVTVFHLDDLRWER